MREVPRECFLPKALSEFAYTDTPLPIAEGQTISQPYIAALMIEAMAIDRHWKACQIPAHSASEDPTGQSVALWRPSAEATAAGLRQFITLDGPSQPLRATVLA